jgi:integrase
MRLTAPTIKALKLPKGVNDVVFFDERLPGFGVRLRASGAKSYLVQYAIAGKTRRFTIGTPAHLDPGKAFDAAKHLLARVRLGLDPVAERDQARTRASETMGAVLPLFMERQRAKQKPRGFLETVRHLEVYAKPLHAYPVAAIDRRMVANLLLELADNRGPGASNRTRAALSAFMSWAVKRGLAPHNEAAYTDRAIEPGARDRVLTDDELRAIWTALADDGYGRVIRLLILTGARRDEIGALRWSEVDPTAAQLNLPGERTKNSRPHIVPLSPPALALLTAQPRTGDLVFSKSAKGFQNWSRHKEALDGRINEREGKPLEPWRLHDFRRSLSTWLHENGAPPHVVESLLGHVSGHKAGVAGTYNRAEYLAERRRWLNRWGEHITGLPASKVVPLRA